uniref:Uncharacterized protein n=1 Tax=Cacopsylla melanoneura TaxID=428564 RepID=A0A8D9FE74_9HEMI
MLTSSQQKLAIHYAQRTYRVHCAVSIHTLISLFEVAKLRIDSPKCPKQHTKNADLYPALLLTLMFISLMPFQILAKENFFRMQKQDNHGGIPNLQGASFLIGAVGILAPCFSDA